MTSRIDIIGTNGGDGSHYLVEKMARKLAGTHPDLVHSGKGGVRRRWEDFVPLAIELIEVVHDEEGETTNYQVW